MFKFDYDITLKKLKIYIAYTMAEIVNELNSAFINMAIDEIIDVVCEKYSARQTSHKLLELSNENVKKYNRQHKQRTKLHKQRDISRLFSYRPVKISKVLVDDDEKSTTKTQPHIHEYILNSEIIIGDFANLMNPRCSYYRDHRGYMTQYEMELELLRYAIELICINDSTITINEQTIICYFIQFNKIIKQFDYPAEEPNCPHLTIDKLIDNFEIPFDCVQKMNIHSYLYGYDKLCT